MLEFLAFNANWRWHQRSDDEWQMLEDFRVRIATLNQRGLYERAFEPLTMRPSRLGNNQWAIDRL